MQLIYLYSQSKQYLFCARTCAAKQPASIFSLILKISQKIFFSKDLSFDAEELQSLTFYYFYLKFYFHCIVLKYIFTKIWTRQAYKTLYQFHNWISSHQILTFEFLKLLICISAVNFYMASDKFFWIFKSLWIIKIERRSSRHNQTPTKILLRVQKCVILVIKMISHLPDVSNYPLKRHESD